MCLYLCVCGGGGGGQGVEKLFMSKDRDQGQYAVKAQTSLAPLSWFRGSRVTTTHAHQCCIFQSYAKTAVANEIDYEIDDAWTNIHGIHDNGPRDHGVWRLTLTAYRPSDLMSLNLNVWNFEVCSCNGFSPIDWRPNRLKPNLPKVRLMEGPIDGRCHRPNAWWTAGLAIRPTKKSCIGITQPTLKIPPTLEVFYFFIIFLLLCNF